MSQQTQPAGELTPVDRRVARTKKALRAALFALIQEKGYESVSVEEIARRADLGRTTFYLHYRDKEDLLLDEFVEMANEQVQAMSSIPLAFWLARSQGDDAAQRDKAVLPLLQVFEHAAANTDLYRVLLRGASAPRFAERIRAIVSRSIEEIVQTKRLTDPTPIQPQVPLDLLGAYFSGALASSLAWWLDQPPPLDAEAMARRFQYLFFPGARKALGL